MALALLMTAGLLVTMPSRAAAAEPDPLVAASNHLFSCVQTARTVSVLFVMDRSGSLERTRTPSDPQGQRFEGMRSALTGLAQLQRPDGRPLTVEAAVSAFNHQYFSAEQIVGWRTINGASSAEEIDRMVQGARLRATSTGGTDFEAALNGGLEDFTTRSGSDSCRIMLWFTDGKFDDAGGLSIDRDGEAAAQRIEQARQQMCAQTGGVVDRIRQAGIVLLGLQLGDPHDDLRRMSIGTLNDQPCGTFPIPAQSAPGGYLQARDINELGWVFGRMADLAQGCTPTGSLGGLVDPGLNRMVVRAQRPALDPNPPSPETVTLIAPGGERLAVTAPGRQEMGGHTIVADRDATQVSAVVTFAEGRGAGTWAFDPGFAVTSDTVAYCVFPDLALVRDEPPSLPRAGTPSELRHVVRTTSGRPADLSVYRDVNPTAHVVAADGVSLPTTVTASGDHVDASVTPRDADAHLTVTTTLGIVTASGLRLPTLTVSYPTIVQSSNLPHIEPGDTLHLGTAHRLEPVRGDLTLVGASAGPSQVCIGAPTVTQPVGQGGSLTVEEACWDLQPEQRIAVPVTWQPGSVVVGDGAATLPLVLKGQGMGDQAQAEASYELPTTWRQDIPANPWVLWGISFLALLVTFGAVFLALFLANWFVARFHTERLRHYSVEVWLNPHGGIVPAHRLGGGARDAATETLFGNQAPRTVAGRRARTLAMGNITLRAKASLFHPLRGPQFFATPASGHRLFSTIGESDPTATWAPVTPTLQDVVLITAADPRIPGNDDQPVLATLHLVTTADGVNDPRPSLSASAIVQKWRAALDRSTATQPPPRFGRKRP